MLPWVLACLLPLTCVHSQAGPILSTDSPVGFFTNAAIRLLLKAGYTVGPPTSTSNLLVTSTASSTPVTSLQIPIWPTNFYTPSVHRLLQLAANLYDATTNRTDNGYPTTYPFLPTIFRPVFRSGSGKEGGNQISIIGYQEVTAADTLTLLSSTTPHDLSEPLDRMVKPLDMVYNIPLVIGAKKGLPNFNEFAAQTTIQVTRKLQFRRNPASNPLPNALNQMFIVGVSNQFGFAAWNSYAANFPRPVQLYAYPDFSVTMTNVETRRPLLLTTYRTNPPPIFVNRWTGYNPSDQYNLSFEVPLATNILFLTNSTYRSPYSGVGNQDQFVPLTSTFEQFTGTNLHVPHLSASVRSRLRFAVVDAGSGRIVDYAILAAQTPLDITDALMHDTPNQYGPGGPGATNFSPQYITLDHPGYLWSTKRQNGATLDSVQTIGIMSQLTASLGHNSPNPPFNNDTLDAPPGMSLSAAIAFFQAQFVPSSPFHTNVFNAPYQPYRNIYLVNVWQANDPLVHYTLGDLAVARTNLFELDIIQSPTPLSTLGSLSARYQPWGGKPGGGSVAPPYSLSYKDPVLAAFGSSDYWDFPTNQLAGASWLGRVHRGTPWQTIYLKAPGTILSFWLPWTANSQLVTNFGQLSTALVPLNGVIYDACLTQPTNDWRLAAMLASLLSPNNARQLLSANQASLPAWEGALDGMVVLTNNEGPDPPEGLTSLVMSSNSPQAATIAAAILTTRASQPNQSFQDPGDVLLTPELSVASPWLDTNNVGPYPANVNDEAYEAIPSQLLSLLRADSIGSVVHTGGTLQIQFSGSDGLAYAVQVSTDLVNWTSLGTSLPYGGVFTFLDFPPPGAPRRFYRSLLLP